MTWTVRILAGTFCFWMLPRPFWIYQVAAGVILLGIAWGMYQDIE